jgi:hypothetical protein
MKSSTRSVFSSDDLQNGLKLLVKSSIARDFSSPQTHNLFAESPEAFTQYQSNVLDINLEEWYNLIAPYTFTTEFMELTTVDAQIFVDNFLFTHEHSGAGVSNEIIRDMESRLNSAFEKMASLHVLPPNTDTYFFVKTSCRSPKDALSMTSRMESRLQETLLSTHNPIDELSENELIIYLLQAGKRSMCVSSAREALDLLLSSRRIYQDYTLALSHPHRWKQNICIRQWRPIEVDMEFRCFVSKGRLTAISQYHHLCFFQRLVDMRDHVLKLISTFFNDHLKAALSPKFQDYIIDMGVLMRNGSFDDGEVLVIELNPFMETTDACCFD